jgi:hypothetical protein
MDLTSQPKTPAAIVDASLLIGFCTKEPNKYGIAKAKLDEYDNDGRQLFAPSVLIGEVLHVLCRKLKDNSLDAAGHASALRAYPKTARDCPHFAPSAEQNGDCPSLPGGFRIGS